VQLGVGGDVRCHYLALTRLTVPIVSAITLTTMNDAVRYDALLESGCEPAVPCPVCTGDEDAEPCGEECDALFQQARRVRAIRALYNRCFQAVGLARTYQHERAVFRDADERVTECMKTVRIYRTSIRCLREQWASRPSRAA